MQRVRLNLGAFNAHTRPETRAVHLPLSENVLRASFAEVSPELYGCLSARMRERNETISTLAQKTRLNNKQTREIVFGQKPPIDVDGNWTNEVLWISEALLTEPEFLFGQVRDVIVARMTEQPNERLPQEPAEEIRHYFPQHI